MHQATLKFLCLDSHSQASATSETIKKCSILLVLIMHLPNLLVLLLGSVCLYEKCLKETRGCNKVTIKKLLRNTGGLSFKC